MQVAQQWLKSVVALLEEESSGIRKYYYDYQNVSEILQVAVKTGKLVQTLSIAEVTDIINNHYYGTVALWCIH